MRIIGGIYKRRRFEVPKGFKARPTTDFAKENLFNVLANYIDFSEGLDALDLFAGTGSISFELMSRGCSTVISLEKEGLHFSFIKKVISELRIDNCIPLKGDVFRYLNSCNRQFDFIFADPPYELNSIDTLPDIIFNKNILKEDGIFVLEHGKDNHFEDHSRFFDKRVYGSVNFSFFRR